MTNGLKILAESLIIRKIQYIVINYINQGSTLTVARLPGASENGTQLARFMVKNFDGLQDSSDGMICTYCKKFPNIAGPSSFISGNKSYRIDGIRSHFSSPKHLQCSEAYFAAQRRENGRSN